MTSTQSGPSPVTRDCLVAVVTDDADLRRFVGERWYRIPSRVLGRTLGRDTLDEARILALYQTSNITEGLPGAIELWGAIDDVVTATRREILPDQPDHPAAEEPYHLIRLSSIERLERPIPSRRPRRLAFLRTTRQRLFHAEDINDLIVGSASEEELWRTLRVLDTERRYLIYADGVAVEIDFAIFRGDHAIGVICDDEMEDTPDDRIRDSSAWRIIRFSPGRLEQDLSRCIDEIMDLVRGVVER